MLKLRDIMTVDVVTVGPDLTIRDAMELFTERHVSGAPVVDGGRVVGVVSATDLLGLLASLSELTRDEREEEPVAAWEETTEVSDRYFGTLWDEVSDSEAIADVSNRERNVLDEITVAEAMTRAPVHRMAPETPVEAAAAYMRQAEIHRLLVMEGERLVGIVSTMDIVKAVAGHRLTALRYVFGPARPDAVVSDRRRPQKPRR
jgi:CBS domain-containing protein